MLFLQKRELMSLWGAISTKKGVEVFMGCYFYKKSELRFLWGAISTKQELRSLWGAISTKKGS